MSCFCSHLERPQSQRGLRFQSQRGLLFIALFYALCFASQIGLAAPKPASDVTQNLRRDGGTIPFSDRESQLWLPVISESAFLKANLAHHWTMEDGARYLHLTGDVTYRIGRFGFAGKDAVVRLKQRTIKGRRQTQLWIFFGQVTRQRLDRNQAATTHMMSGANILTTTVTTGEIELSAVQMLPHESTVTNQTVLLAYKRFKAREAKLADMRHELDLNHTLSAQKQKKQRVLAEINRRKKYIETEGAKQALAPVWDMIDSRKPSHQVLAANKQSKDELDSDKDSSTFPVKGRLSYYAKDALLQLPQGDQEGYAVIPKTSGGASLQLVQNDRSMTLRAERVVILFNQKQSGSAVSGSTINLSHVRGIYLEGGVIISDGDHTLRTPKAYYDLLLDKALILDAVLYTERTTKQGKQIPIYLRAKEIAMFSRSELLAGKASLSTSEFFTPHIAIAADQVMLNPGSKKADSNSQSTATESTVATTDLKKDEAKDQDTDKTDSGVTAPLDTNSQFVATDITLRAKEVPFAYWPFVQTGLSQFPLERMSMTHRGDTGIEIRTRWDMNQLANLNLPEETSLKLDLDQRGIHGPGAGLHLSYNHKDFFGESIAYALGLDSGDDRLPGRTNISHDDDFRGLLLVRHKHQLPENWELSLEVGQVSDPTFLEEIFPRIATNDKPLETSFYLKRQEGESALSLLIKNDFNDFISNTAVLQAPVYTVDKLPEIAHFEIGSPLFGDRITYYAENRYSNARLHFGSETPAQHGFNPAQSAALYGLPNTLRFDLAADLLGRPLDTVNRFDTRHEIQAPMAMGDFIVTPFATGVISAIEGDHQGFAGVNDQLRFTGTVGAHVSTQFQRVYPDFHIPILDAWQLRHIVEPHLSFSTTDTSIEPGFWPNYIDEFDGFTEGGTARAALRHTFQTKRGGTGRWRNVDWLIVETDVVHRSDRRDNFRSIPQYIAYRPELSRGGDHASGTMKWQATQHMAVTSDAVFNLESDQFDQWGAVCEIDHGDGFMTFADYSALQSRQRTIYQITIQDRSTPDPNDTIVVNRSRRTSIKTHHQFGYGFQFDMTDIYSVAARHSIDLTGNDTYDQISTTLRRRMHRFTVDMGVDYDRVDGETTLSVVVTPDGLNLKNLLR